MAGTRRIASDVMIGAPHYTPGLKRTAYHNSVFLVGHGEVAGRYDKQKFLPVAEESLWGVLSRRPTSFTPGPQSRPLGTQVAPVGAFVCFEAMYPELAGPGLSSRQVLQPYL